MDLARLSGIDPRDVVFFMACSNRKVETDQKLPLIDLYDGPTWQTLRVHGQFLKQSQIIVLSGLYGWCSAMLDSKPYNQRISPEKVEALVALGACNPVRAKGLPAGWTPAQLVSRGDGKPYKAVVVCGGELYRRAFDAVIPELRDLGYIEAFAPTFVTEGGIGEQRGQLGDILRAIAPEPEASPGSGR